MKQRNKKVKIFLSLRDSHPCFSCPMAQKLIVCYAVRLLLAYLLAVGPFNATESLKKCSSPTRTSEILDFLSTAAEMASLACEHLCLNMKNPTTEILRHRSGTCSLLNYDDS